MNLRPYQESAHQRIRELAWNGQKRILLVAPTGSGKTMLASAIIAGATANGHRSLFLAHRSELIDQSAATLERFGLDVGVICASSDRAPRASAAVQVASIQTLTARDERPPARIVVVDECHHATAGTWRDLLEAYPDALILGLTATPERGDGTGLGEVFKELVVVATVRQLTEEGHLVPCEIIRPAAVLQPGQIAARPVDAYLAHAKGRSTLVYSPSVAIAHQHAEEFNKALGGGAMVICGETPAEVRRTSVELFRTGALPVLVSVGVLTEGTDLPIASCAILARGCGTTGLYLQIAGRVLRPHPGKTDALLIDLRGVSHVHGHPEDDRTYSLTGKGIRTPVDPGSLQSYCRVCGAPIVPSMGCDECGASARAAQPLVVTNTPLVRYAAKRAEGPEQRQATLQRWLAEAAARGFKRGWAYAKYKAVYGEYPQWDSSPARPMDDSAEVAAAARAVVDWMGSQGLATASVRDAHYSLRGQTRFAKATDVRRALDVAEELGYLRRIPDEEGPRTGRPPSPRYTVRTPDGEP